MEFDPQTIVVGGVSGFVLLLFLVQTVREALDLEGKYIPAVAAVLGITLMLAVALLPEIVLIALAQGLALAAAVSLSVRYVKESPHGTTRPDPLQGHHSQTTRISPSRTQTTSTAPPGGQPDVRYLGETQPIPDLEEDEWTRNRYG